MEELPYEPPLRPEDLAALEAWWRGLGGEPSCACCVPGSLCAPEQRPAGEWRAQRLLAAVVGAQRRVARAEAEAVEALAALVALYRGPGTGVPEPLLPPQDEAARGHDDPGAERAEAEPLRYPPDRPPPPPAPPSARTAGAEPATSSWAGLDPGAPPF